MKLLATTAFALFCTSCIYYVIYAYCFFMEEQYSNRSADGDILIGDCVSENYSFDDKFAYVRMYVCVCVFEHERYKVSMYVCVC